MKAQTLKITLSPGLSKGVMLNTSYWRNYPDGRKELLTLTTDGKVVSGTLSPNEKKLRFPFGDTNRAYISKISFDTPDNAIKKMMMDRAILERDFWENHENVRVIGKENKNLIMEYFVLEVLEDMEQMAYDLEQKKLRVRNMCNNIDEESRENILYFFGGNPKGKTSESIWMELVSDTGKLIENDNMEKFIDMMKDEKREELITRTIIKKAISFGVILTENNQYLTKTRELLGLSEDDLYAHYTMKSPNEFAFLRQSVASLEGTKPDALLIKEVKQEKAKAK